MKGLAVGGKMSREMEEDGGKQEERRAGKGGGVQKQTNSSIKQTSGLC